MYVHNSVWYLPIYPLYIQEGADQAQNAGKEVSETQKLQKSILRIIAGRYCWVDSHNLSWALQKHLEVYSWKLKAVGALWFHVL